MPAPDRSGRVEPVPEEVQASPQRRGASGDTGPARHPMSGPDPAPEHGTRETGLQ
jgi:hypothetical protein